jgi:hypothetical protein
MADGRIRACGKVSFNAQFGEATENSGMSSSEHEQSYYKYRIDVK